MNKKMLRAILALILFVSMAVGIIVPLAGVAKAAPYSSPWSYTITLDANTGMLETKDMQDGLGQQYKFTVKLGALTTVPNVIPWKNGYRFIGWGEKSNSTSAKFTSGQKDVSFNASKVYYAVWIPYMEISADRVAGLIGRDFIRIHEDGKPNYWSYGAKQSYREYTTNTRILNAFVANTKYLPSEAQKYISGKTCGTFAAVNTALYAKGERTVEPSRVINEIVTYYGYATGQVGRTVSGGESPKNIRTYLMCKGFKNVKWNYANDREKVYNGIVSMLKSNLPVIMSFDSRSSDGIHFYYISNHRLIPSIKDVNSHYYVVTGVFRDPNRPSDIWFETSSWGEKLYISWIQYSNYRSNNIFYGDYINGYMTFTK